MSEEAVMDTENTQEESGSLLSPSTAPEATQDTPTEMPHMVQEDQLAEGDGEIDWGDRPDYIPEQFWDPKDGPDLEGMAKAYQEMRTKMSQGKHKAPKDGAYDIAALKDHGVTDDDPLLNQFKGFAAENGLSQDQFDQITQMYMNHMGEMMGDIETSREAEMAKLGPKGEKVVSSLNQWLTKLGNSGALSADEVDAIAAKADNANFIMALNKIRQSYGEQAIPDITVQEGNTYSKADLEAMLADPRYGKDMHYTQQVEQKFYDMYS